MAIAAELVRAAGSDDPREGRPPGSGRGVAWDVLVRLGVDPVGLRRTIEAPFGRTT